MASILRSAKNLAEIKHALEQLCTSVLTDAEHISLLDALYEDVIPEWGTLFTRTEIQQLLAPLFSSASPIAFGSSTFSRLSSSAILQVEPCKQLVLSRLEMFFSERKDVLLLLRSLSSSSSYFFCSSGGEISLSPSACQIINHLCSLSERVTNILKHNTPSSLSSKFIFSSISSQCSEFLLDILSSTSPPSPYGLALSSYLFHKIITLGHGDILFQHVLPILAQPLLSSSLNSSLPCCPYVALSDSERQTVSSFSQNWLLTLSHINKFICKESSAENYFYLLLHSLSQYERKTGTILLYHMLYGAEPEIIRYLFTNKFLSVRLLTLPALHLLSKYLRECASQNATHTHNQSTATLTSGSTSSSSSFPVLDVLGTIRSSLSLWSGVKYITQATEKQHEYLTLVLLLLVKDTAHIDISSFLSILLYGVQSHMENNLSHIKAAGMVVAERFSHLISPDHVLHFDRDSDEITVYIDKYTRMLQEDVGPGATEAPTVTTENKKEEQSCEKMEVKKEAKSSRRKKTRARKAKSLRVVEEEEEEGEDPDAIALPKYKKKAEEATTKEENEENDDEAEEEEKEEEGGISDVSSEDADLIPYDLQDDMSDLQQKNNPKYLVDILSALRSDDADLFESSLSILPELIRQAPSDLDEVVVSIVSCLLSLENKFSFERFDECRYNSLLACLIMSTQKSATFLLHEFHDGRKYTISVRLDILTLLRHAASELAGNKQSKEERKDLPFEGGVISSSVSSSSSLAPSLSHAQEIVNKRIQQNTRRWTKRKNTEAGSVNSFLPFSELFFYGIINTIKLNPSLNSFDFLLLGNVLYTLSHIILQIGSWVSVDTIRMCISLLDLVLSLRYVNDTNLMRQCLFCVYVVLSYIPHEQWLNEYNYLLQEIANFAQGVLSSVSDVQCVSMSNDIITIINKIIQ